MAERADNLIILVTGGAGYVGSHAVVRLLEDGYFVVVVDNVSNCYIGKGLSQPESLIRAQVIAGRRLHFYSLDITCEKSLREVFMKHKIDCVMHFAALKSVSESCRIPLSYYSNNINGTLILLKIMKEFGVTLMIYSSSATVYGTPQSLPITESHPTGQSCTNPYGKSKYMVEEMLRDICLSDPGWRVVSLRYFNPVGAHPSGKLGEDPEGIPNNLMPYVAKVAQGTLPILRVYGGDYDTPDGTGVRDYIHIQDLIEGHTKALDRIISGCIKGFNAYNLGTGTGHSVIEVLKAFADASGKRIPYEIVGRREGDVAISYCDANLAKRELGWTATKTLHDMCSDVWRWQKLNPEGYKTCSSL